MDAWRFLSGGEVLVSTGLELARATPEAREAYLRALVDAGAQALVLELVQWLREVPDEMLRTARLMDFPLIVFREEVRFAELTKGAHESILKPHVPADAEQWLDGLLDALVETGRSARFLEEQLGPILSLPGRPEVASATPRLCSTPVQRGDCAAPGGVARAYYRLSNCAGCSATRRPRRRMSDRGAELFKAPAAV
jgi:purine catabolism regulator